MTPDTGFGTLVAYHSGFIAKSFDFNLSGAQRKEIDITNNAQVSSQTAGIGVAKTFMPSDLVDNGNLEGDLFFDPDTAPPLDQAAETMTVTFPVPSGKTNGATWSGSAFMTSYSAAVAMDDAMKQKVTVKWAGAITVTPSS